MEENNNLFEEVNNKRKTNVKGYISGVFVIVVGFYISVGAAIISAMMLLSK